MRCYQHQNSRLWCLSHDLAIASILWWPLAHYGFGLTYPVHAVILLFTAALIGLLYRKTTGSEDAKTMYVAILIPVFFLSVFCFNRYLVEQHWLWKFNGWYLIGLEFLIFFNYANFIGAEGERLPKKRAIATAIQLTLVALPVIFIWTEVLKLTGTFFLNAFGVIVVIAAVLLYVKFIFPRFAVNKEAK